MIIYFYVKILKACSIALALSFAMQFYPSTAKSEESIDGKDLKAVSVENEDLTEQKNIDLSIDPDVLMQHAGEDFEIELQNQIIDEKRKQAASKRNIENSKRKQAASKRNIENSKRNIENSKRKQRKAIEELETAIEGAKKKSN